MCYLNAVIFSRTMEDYWYVILAVIVVIILMILMYTGSVYATREISFENALTEQQQRQLSSSSSSGKTSERKVRRQYVKSSSAKQHPQSTMDSPGHSKKKVELELEPEIIDEDVNVVKKSEELLSLAPAKSILVNKDEKGVIVVEPEEIPELFHRHTSVDEFEIKLEERRKSDPNAAAAAQSKVVAKKKKQKSTAGAVLDQGLFCY